MAHILLSQVATPLSTSPAFPPGARYVTASKHVSPMTNQTGQASPTRQRSIQHKTSRLEYHSSPSTPPSRTGPLRPPPESLLGRRDWPACRRGSYGDDSANVNRVRGIRLLRLIFFCLLLWNKEGTRETYRVVLMYIKLKADSSSFRGKNPKLHRTGGLLYRSFCSVLVPAGV